jgi:hypothetical protein
VAAGVAVAAGHLPYLAGAGRTLTTTAERIVQSGERHLVSGAAGSGAPKRLVLALGAVLAVLLPGVTALLLILSARVGLRLRSLVALAVTALGAASFFYQPHGRAAGVLVLALIIGGLAVALTGPALVTPLAFAATLIGATFLPTLFTHRAAATDASVDSLHEAIYGRPGTPLALQLALLILAALPFAAAARLALRS